MDAKNQNLKKKVSFKIDHANDIRRIYFNRFSFTHTDGVRRVTIWNQDEFTRISNIYSFIFDDEDFNECNSSIKNYIQRLLKNKPNINDGSSEVDITSSVNAETVDFARIMTCAYLNNRAEIYLGFFPIASMDPRAVRSDDKTIPLDVALCSKTGCHVELLRKMVEK